MRFVWIYSFIKRDQKKEEEGAGVTKGEIKIYEEMRRKNLIRDVLRENKGGIDNNKKEKDLKTLNDQIPIRKDKRRESIKDVNIFSNILREAKKEIRNVTKEIDECKESKMKYELNQYLVKRVNNLQKLILEVQNSL